MVEYSTGIAIVMLVAVAEIIFRYWAAPKNLLATPAAYLYVLANIAAAAGVIHGLSGMRDTVSFVGAMTPLGLGISAGTLTCVALRSSLMSLQIGEESIQVGPAVFFNSILGLIDRSLDRRHALDVAQRLEETANAISLSEAVNQLPTLLLSLTPLAEPSEIEDLHGSIAKAVQLSVSEKSKITIILMRLVEVFGMADLDRSIRILKGPVIPFDLQARERTPVVEVFPFGNRIRQTMSALGV